MRDNNTVIQPGGLSTDTSYVNQPQGATTFVLNGVNETDDGDINFISNEESNEKCISLKPDFIPIGKCYIGSNETVIFSVSKDNSISEIGILKNNCQYEVQVNDEFSSNADKLNFKIEHQIQATFRLRRGCERTIYFTDDYNKPRYYNLDKSENFLEGGLWVGKKFDLFRTINSLPELLETKILENSGSLLPGSYSILLQYLDEDYNGTKFLELISNINIINDSLKNSYVDIEGSTNIAVDVIKSPPTNKAIQIKLGSLDKSYTYFRLAIVEYNNGTGQVSGVKYTSAISTETNIVLYTGTNASENGTIEEVELSSINSGIYKVGSLEQIDNKLILANISGPQYNYCGLQKYASKIKADVIIKDILLISVHEDHNTKNPLVHHNGLSHQPGDIYSYGIVYIFEDLTESPVFHIPGKNNSLADTTTFTRGQANVKGMKSSNNKNLSEFYINTNSCGINDYWGKDSEGQDLTGTNVRHHRFPTRDEIGIGFVEEIAGSTNTLYKKLALNLEGIIKKSILCTPITDTTCPDYYKAPIFTLTVKYKLNGINKKFTSPNITEFNTPTFIYSNIFLDTDIITDIELWYKESNSSAVQITLTGGNSSLQNNNLIYKISEVSSEEETGIIKYKVPILGIKFSGIDIPSEADSNGKIIGYKIVRQERKDTDKNIMDSAVLLPMLTNNIGQGNFISSSMIAPALDNGSYSYGAVSKNTLQILSPSHKFTDKNMEGYTSIEEVGKFNLITNNVTGHLVQDVQPGSSADGVDDISDNTKDNDGFSLKQMVRMSRVKYNKSTSNKLIIDNIDTDLFNLQPLKTATHSDGESTITNLSCDNKSLILSKKSATVDYNRYKSSEQYYPYVYIKKDNSTFYSNYRNNIYYQTDHKIHVDKTCELYSGDTHISPLKYSNHIYGNTITGRRLSDFNWGGLITTILVTIFAVVISIVTFGAAAPASIAAISLAVGAMLVSVGSIAMFVSGVIDAQDFANLYQEKWSKGLDFTLFDIIYQQLFYEPDTAKPREQLCFRDDTIKWYGETIQDFWFESPLNVSLRVPYNNNISNYLKPLTNISPNRPDKIQFLREVSKNREIDNVDDYWHYRDDSLNWDCYEENYFGKKILEWKNNKWNYRGISEPILYMLNNDHNVNKNIIKYYALPQEYDCCSDCTEKFPHRWHWSEQSFQEELTDNYRMFLPNNYKDISGETGGITNIFKINNDLFLHTEEALWQIPRNYQERVTDQVVSFIGTGSYGELPERKMIDDDTGSSAGSQHKWGLIKTPSGIFFPSENQRKIYQFEGGQLKPISSMGIGNWFQNNMELLLNKQYYNSTGKKYSYNDNPSNPFGTGFISTYDTKKERIIFTKKDFIFNSGVIDNPDFELCVNNGQMTYFPNYNQVIQTEQASGWSYEGLTDCKMKFSKSVTKTRQEHREIQTWHPEVIEQVASGCVNGTWNFQGSHGNTAGSGSDAYNVVYTLCGGTPYNYSVPTIGIVNVDETFTGCYLSPPALSGNFTETFTHIENNECEFNTIITPGYYTTETVIVDIPYSDIEYKYIDGEVLNNPVQANNSWTMSYSLKENKWVSWHSYLPNFYINVPDKFYSWIYGNNNIWKHNKEGHYQTFYDKLNPFVLEYVDNNNPLVTKIYDAIKFQTEAKQYLIDSDSYVDKSNITFNKILLYNTHQISGILDMLVKDVDLEYVNNQVLNSLQSIHIDRNERDWCINDLRDLSVNPNVSIFNKNLTSLQADYFIDKIVNSNRIDYNKDWTEMESFRDKFMVIRLIFDTFDTTRLIMNFSIQDSKVSER
ncbi:virion structural protein [Flavobacterium phage Fpv1]|uniref:Structural protein n=2 Tax=Fipvunavirus Fpv1 TaxID=2560475 RepID=A0A1B0WKK3_9CAUD|nr:virion structural protein [Flavobacterium phage Fpv20]YP_009322032.1 virion structural protein [Flavobacterium phage Fpv1]YP_009323621.1 virion structural protein [Flavobacterium phage Fpv2]ALN97276.1 structural protein [Flavobacterium phage FpV21]QCW20313.1 structural protein [Flavobacterium phage FPSV-F12]ANB40272.1 structural protein [Flavobacterium phage Fpv1]ANB40352.1 structural protein [Flavobacterium phage Fpv2]ANB40859.1 structural protein [Flavobacterium phage Fpv20]